ncbi:MAG: hypothetical protein GY941_10525 [Planctomycetes bacterium]|nr:hypothetical protein [Planctomycetota bacterium]
MKTVSEYTSIPVKTLYEWSILGKIPSIKIGRRRLFDLSLLSRICGSLNQSCTLKC